MQMSASDPIRYDPLGRRQRVRPGAVPVPDLRCICFHLEHNQCTHRSLAPALSLADSRDGVCCLPRCAINDAFRLKFSGKTLFDALSNYDYGVCLLGTCEHVFDSIGAATCWEPRSLDHSILPLGQVHADGHVLLVLPSGSSHLRRF